MNNVPDFIWPWWLRLSHWLVATGVFAMWLMSHVWHETSVYHRSLGYALVALVAARLVAGLMTPQTTARLHLPHWQAIAHHLGQLRRGQLEIQRGHNPLGQYGVYLMWILLSLLALTGWLSRSDAFWGEDWPVALHAALSWALLAMVALHVLAVWYISRLTGQALLKQMLDGHLHTDDASIQSKRNF